MCVFFFSVALINKKGTRKAVGGDIKNVKWFWGGGGIYEQKFSTVKKKQKNEQRVLRWSLFQMHWVGNMYKLMTRDE